MLLIIDNYDSFTYNLVHRVGEVAPGLEVVVKRNDEIGAGAIETLDDGRPPSHIIVSPGPCTPAESGCSREVVERFAGRVPILGVCLGHQAIGDVGGMSVVRAARPMHGKTSLVHHDGEGVFAGLGSPFQAMRYHSLVVREETIPARAADGSGWIVSAWTDEPVDAARPDGPTTRVVMGLRRRWGDRGNERGDRGNGGNNAPLEGVQFHPESFMTPQGPKLLANFLQAVHA